MGLEGTFLTSRVARRVYGSFIACALVPLAALAVLSFRTVSQQLHDQAVERLHRDGRIVINGIFERLELLEARLALFADGSEQVAPDAQFARDLSNVWLLEQGVGRLLRGAGSAPVLSPAQLAHVEQGRTLLAPEQGPFPTVYVAWRVGDDGAVLVGELAAGYPWQARDGTLPVETEACVFTSTIQPLFCSPAIAPHAELLAAAMGAPPAPGEPRRTDSRDLEVVLGSDTYLADVRNVSTAFRFLMPGFTVVVARSETSIVAPRSRFTLYFAGIVVLSLSIVMLLSSVQIRRSLGPVAALEESTRRLAGRDFSARVDLRTGDEFEQLGTSFNSMAEQIGGLIEELGELNDGTLKALARTVDAKSPWTAGHSERVTEMAVRIGEAMGMDDDQLSLLERGALVHDIGKIGVPAAVLDKPGRLTDEEFRLMQEHPVKGQRILEPIPGYASIIPIVRQHHERLDGRGYPDGLTGDEIDPMARIVAVADVFDAMISDRPYRDGLPLERVIETIRGAAGTEFDPEAVDAFLRVTVDQAPD